MLFRRSKSDPTEIRAYICYAPHGTPAQKLVETAGIRWTVEMCFKESKGEVGLDQYEVRSYDSWYKHITFALLALALITVLSAKSLDTKTLQQHNPASKTLDEFKRGRNLRVWARLIFVRFLIVFTNSCGRWVKPIFKSGLTGAETIKPPPCGITIIKMRLFYCNTNWSTCFFIISFNTLLATFRTYRLNVQ